MSDVDVVDVEKSSDDVVWDIHVARTFIGWTATVANGRWEFYPWPVFWRPTRGAVIVRAQRWCRAVDRALRDREVVFLPEGREA